MPKFAASVVPTSTFSEVLRSPAMIGMLAAPIVGIAATAAQGALQRRALAKQKVTSFSEMMELHPHLKSKDPQELMRMYNSLHNASPLMARDPMVAGAWIDNIYENRHPGMNSHQALLNAVKDLSGIQKNISDSMANEYRSRTQWGAEAANVARGIGQTIQDVQSNGVEARRRAYQAELEAERADLMAAKQRAKDQDTADKAETTIWFNRQRENLNDTKHRLQLTELEQRKARADIAEAFGSARNRTMEAEQRLREANELHRANEQRAGQLSAWHKRLEEKDPQLPLKFAQKHAAALKRASRPQSSLRAMLATMRI